MDQSEYPVLRSSLERLTLNDSSVSINPDSSSALGQGWRIGFLGLLHMEVFTQRLEEVEKIVCLFVCLLFTLSITVCNGVLYSIELGGACNSLLLCPLS